jgi:hypothetical protein
MKTRTIVGVAGFLLTMALMIPVLFVLSRGAVSTNQFVLILSGVLLLVLWTIPYVTLIDPLLRRAAGAVFGVTIEWRGPRNSLSWTPVEATGCLSDLVIGSLGYLLIGLWFVPFAAAVVLVLWFGH